MSDEMHVSPESLFGVGSPISTSIREMKADVGPMLLYVDASLPPGTIEFRQDGLVVGRIVNACEHSRDRLSFFSSTMSRVAYEGETITIYRGTFGLHRVERDAGNGMTEVLMIERGHRDAPSVRIGAKLVSVQYLESLASA